MRQEPVGTCGCRLVRTESGLSMKDCPLRAAAPRLLAALEEISKLSNEYIDNRTQKQVNKIHYAAMAALALAKGE